MNHQQKPKTKKSLGQHFLRKDSTVDHMIEKVSAVPADTILEIGCGDGFLTRAILNQLPANKLICYEIDSAWADFVKKSVPNKRLEIRVKNILQISQEELEAHAPWVVLANLPYQITFPIFFLFHQYRHLIKEGVVMVQEEVAQKIVAKRGRASGRVGMFLQYYFHLELMEKIEPGAFFPPPKVFSRLIYFKPKVDLTPIPQEEDFWIFVQRCFQSPRRTLKNNLRTYHYSTEALSEELLSKRAQELSFDAFLELWANIQAA